jgi:hypothetical protein
VDKKERKLKEDESDDEVANIVCPILSTQAKAKAKKKLKAKPAEPLQPKVFVHMHVPDGLEQSGKKQSHSGRAAADAEDDEVAPTYCASV